MKKVLRTLLAVAIGVVGLAAFTGSAVACMFARTTTSATLEAGGAMTELTNGSGIYSWYEFDPDAPSPPRESGQPACGGPQRLVTLAADAAFPTGPVVTVPAFPFTGTVHFETAPTAVTVSLRRIPVGGSAIETVDGGAWVAPVDADSWSVVLGSPVPDHTQVILDVTWDFGSGRSGIGGTASRSFAVRSPVPAPLVPAPAPGAPRAAVSAAPKLRLLGAARRGSTVVVRVRANVSGTLRTVVRQGRSTGSAQTRELSAGTHRLVLPLPAAGFGRPSVTLRLTDAGGRAARLTAVVRR